jgi:Arsenical resistance operon protein ArsD
MNDTQSFPTSAASAAATPAVEVFDPPLCCPTGLCGPTLDQTLLDFNEMVQALKAEGVGIERYQMAAQPQIFLKHPTVMHLVRERGMAAFPITVVAGRVIKVGAYPTRAEIDQTFREAEGATR